jgi:hypothetical protein
MSLSAIAKRVLTLETMATQARRNQGSICRSGQPMNYGTGAWVGELEGLTQEAKLITEQAKAAGDWRTALASIRVRCSIAELAAKICGDLDERSPTNIVNVNLDSETARRIAETYLERHKPPEVESK